MRLVEDGADEAAWNATNEAMDLILEQYDNRTLKEDDNTVWFEIIDNYYLKDIPVEITNQEAIVAEIKVDLASAMLEYYGDEFVDVP